MAMGVMELFRMQNVLARYRQQDRNAWAWDHLISGKNVTLCVLLGTAFILYTEFLFQDVMQREYFPGYLSHYSSDYSKNRYGTAKSLAPAAAFNIGTDDHHTTLKPEDHAFGPGTMKKRTQDVQEGIQVVANSTTAKLNSPVPLRKFTVLVGVFMMAFEFGRREIIRSANAVQSSEYADFTVRFIMGGYTLPEWLADENATHGDLIVLQCKENLNNGKTFTYFSSLPAIMGDIAYDYVMKTDDDSYVRFENLGKHLKPLPRTDLYYGYSLPCNSSWSGTHFRVGAGYVLSWDLVLWIRDSPIPRNNSIGTEDQLVGDWFLEGGVAKNQPTERGLFHDHPDQGGTCAQNLTGESILIHKLKSDERWHEVVNFFEKYNNLSKSLNN